MGVTSGDWLGIWNIFDCKCSYNGGKSGHKERDRAT